jgi:hypothetical protein
MGGAGGRVDVVGPEDDWSEVDAMTNYEREAEDLEEVGRVVFVPLQRKLSELEMAQEQCRVLEVKLKGAEERVQIVLRSRDRWLERAQEAYSELNAITCVLSHGIEQSGVEIQPTDLPNRLANLLTVLICERDLARETNGNLEARAIAAEQRAGELEEVARRITEFIQSAEERLGKLKGE